jgi:murein DD-endopeptidase MepM/ murein hydrolase activator NlpD
MRFLLALALLFICGAIHAVELTGEAVQGGLLFGQAEPGSSVSLDGAEVAISPAGQFVIGFGRDEVGERELRVTSPGGEIFQSSYDVKKSQYDIERVDGLPPSTVTPDPEATARIREEARMVATARQHRDIEAYYAVGFIWPAKGRISGVYGSQRVLNGNPRNPHYGLDIAAPEGTDVFAPADGLVTLTHPGMLLSGGTIILDHGQGLSSTFLHLSEILVEAGTFVNQGDLIARIGSTGRASGPHLDWRMNWLDRRVNPQLLMSPMEAP